MLLTELEICFLFRPFFSQIIHYFLGKYVYFLSLLRVRRFTLNMRQEPAAGYVSLALMMGNRFSLVIPPGQEIVSIFQWIAVICLDQTSKVLVH